VFGDNFTLRSEIGNPILRQSPIGQDGLAAKPITWVEKGVVKNLFYDRFWAQRQKKEPPSPRPA
jgi:predicted Zn-dependent protease